MHSHHDPTVDVSNHVEEALQLLESKEGKKLSELLENLHPVEQVVLIRAVDTEVQPQLLKHITGLDDLAEVVALASDQLREIALSLIDDSRIAAVVRRLEIDDAADVVGLLPRRRQVRVLKRLGAEKVKELTTLLAYDQDTAGGIMNPRFLSFSEEVSVGDTITSLRTKLHDKEIDTDTEFFCGYILDSNDTLLGTFSMRELLSADPETLLSDVVTTDLVTVGPEDDQEKVARLIADYDLTAIPVISEENGKMLGIVTVDDVLDVIVEESTEDLLKLAGTEDQDTVGASVGVAIRSRLPWLVASWLGGIAAAVLLGNFSSILEKVVALAFFMPVVFGMGGNVGSQSSTITVHGLATGDLGEHKIWRRLQKEALVGLMLGILFGVLLGIASLILFGDGRLSIIVGISIMATMVCATSLGSMLPVVLQKLGFDPAVASGPFVTTGTDILSITIYFVIAMILL